jgi:hypothetical protein
MVGDPDSTAGVHPVVDRVVLARSARLRHTATR